MQNTVRTWNFNIIDFCEIVIPSCQPEHGNAVDAGSGCLISKFDRTQSFENRKQRAAEESHCWPVTTVAAPARSRAIFSSALAEAPHFLFCASRTEDTCAR